MDTSIDNFGILGQPAPEFGVSRWVGPSGEPLSDLGLAQMRGAYKLLYCFQSACPGCHSHGFPALIRLVSAFRGSKFVSFAAIQTVFEDWSENTFEQILQLQQRHALLIPFGHDAGDAAPGEPPNGSVLMRRYRSGGTPWFILIGPDGRVTYNHFRIDVDKTIAMLHRAEAAPPAQSPAGGAQITWREVLQFANRGNPTPPRRVEKSDDRWRAQLTDEQYRITRQKGTERAHSSAMCALFEPGHYRCVCCGTELFDASGKFKSRSGWPSFAQPAAPDVIAYQQDESHGMRRIEATCNVCDAHLGHVFPDGPEPSGLRYCMNAEALSKTD